MQRQSRRCETFAPKTISVVELAVRFAENVHFLNCTRFLSKEKLIQTHEKQNK